MQEKILHLIEEYKETEDCLNLGLQQLPDNNGAKAKIEVLRMVIMDLESSLE